MLRTATTEVKGQISSVKRQISEGKLEVNRLSEETKNLKV